jgi:hypothetical protein
MPEEIRVGRPQYGSEMPSGGGANKMPWIVLAVVVLILLVGGVLMRDRLFPSNDNANTATTEEKLSGYQAVFLTNGQVYFGNLSGTAGDYATLKDIYYLQVTQPPLQGSQQQGQTQAQQQAQLSLVKLGNELHGPVDEMKINRDQILFYEDIKEDGRVMQAIREYQKNPPAQGNNQQQTPAPSGTLPANTGQTPAPNQ